jgi:PAS domain S-box-containing protein
VNAPDPSSRTHRPLIGILANKLVDPYQSGMWAGMEAQAKESGCDLLIFSGGELGSLDSAEQMRNEVFKLATAADADALVLLAPVMMNDLTPEEVQAFIQALPSVPIVVAGMEIPDIPAVLVDNAAGMSAMVEHVLGFHGCRRPLFLGGAIRNPEAMARRSAFRAVMAQHGLELDPMLDQVADWDFHQGHERVLTLLDADIPFDAIIAANDEMALGAMEALKERGKQIPQDLLVTGFDDMEEARFSDPGLSSVRQPMSSQGRLCLKLALDLLQGHPVPPVSLQSPSLVLRGSCGCDETRPAIASTPAVESYRGEGTASHLEVERWIRQLHETGGHLLSRTDTAGLLQTLAKDLPLMHLDACHVLLREEGYEGLRRALSFVNGHKQDLDPEGELLPIQGGLRLLAERYGIKGTLTIEPLFFEQTHLGFVVLDLKARQGMLLEALRTQISSVLMGSRMARDYQSRTQELEQSLKALLSTVIDTVPDYIYVKDRDSRFIVCNHAVAENLGLPMDQILGKTDFDFFPAELAQQYFDDEQSVIRSGIPLINREEINHYPTSNTWGWHLTTTVPLRDARGSIAGIVGLSRNITKHKAQEEALRESLVHQQVARKLIDSQEQERKRIAAELHDGLGQNLLVAKNQILLALRGLDPKSSTAESLRDTNDVITLALQEIREISYKLRPHQLDDLGLSQGLEAMVRRLSHNLELEIQSHVDPVDGIFSPELETYIYRIAQEALNNVIKHAQAQAISLSLKREPGSVELQICDDGKGFDTRSDSEGLGLRIMSERARMLGGELTLHSEPGLGTRLTVHIPIPAEHR